MNAQWIRGRVFPSHRSSGIDEHEPFLMWGMEVVNLRTGKVLVSDNCRDLGKLMDECLFATTAARATWFYGLKRKDVR